MQKSNILMFNHFRVIAKLRLSSSEGSPSTFASREATDEMESVRRRPTPSSLASEVTDVVDPTEFDRIRLSTGATETSEGWARGLRRDLRTRSFFAAKCDAGWIRALLGGGKDKSTRQRNPCERRRRWPAESCEQLGEGLNAAPTIASGRCRSCGGNRSKLSTDLQI